MSDPRILVIEDEVPIRRFLRIAIESAGFTMLEAERGRTGVERAATEAPDLVVLDLGLPDMDGKAVIPDFRPNHQRAIIKGDGCSAASAAASVIAKHYRDSMVKRLALEYPGYGWEDNMGYPTPAHLRGIRELGITPLHRKNFKKVHEQLKLALTP